MYYAIAIGRKGRVLTYFLVLHHSSSSLVDHDSIIPHKVCSISHKHALHYFRYKALHMMVKLSAMHLTQIHVATQSITFSKVGNPSGSTSDFYQWGIIEMPYYITFYFKSMRNFVWSIQLLRTHKLIIYLNKADWKKVSKITANFHLDFQLMITYWTILLHFLQCLWLVYADPQKKESTAASGYSGHETQSRHQEISKSTAKTTGINYWNCLRKIRLKEIRITYICTE